MAYRALTTGHNLPGPLAPGDPNKHVSRALDVPVTRTTYCGGENVEPTPEVLDGVVKTIYKEVHTCFRRMPFHSVWEFTDLFNEGITVFCSACTKYDDSKGASFNTYLTRRLKCHLGTVLSREWSRYGRRVDWETTTLVPARAELHQVPAVEELVNPEKVSQLGLVFLNHLLAPPEPLKELMKRWWDNSTRRNYRELKGLFGEYLGLSKYQIEGLVRELRDAAV